MNKRFGRIMTALGFLFCGAKDQIDWMARGINRGDRFAHLKCYCEFELIGIVLARPGDCPWGYTVARGDCYGHCNTQ